MLIRAFAFFLAALPLSAAEWSWPASQQGEALPAGWTLAKAATSSATVAFAEGALVLAADRGWHAMLQRELDQVDGSDAAPLRFEASIASLTAGVPKGGPTGIALYWTPRHFVMLGQASWHGYTPDPDRTGEPQRRRAWCTVDDGTERRSLASQTEVRQGEVPGFYRIMVTSRAISAQVSADGITYEEVANLPRASGGFAGPPRLALVGRPWWGEPGKEPAGLAADAPDGRLTGERAAWRIDDVRLTTDPPALGADARPLPVAPERAQALAAAFTVPTRWEVGGAVPFDQKRVGLLRDAARSGATSLADGTALAWKELKRPEGSVTPVVPVEQVLPVGDRQLVVLRTRIHAEQARRERVWFDGGARGLWVWVDGRPAGEEWVGDGQPSLDPDRQSALVHLRAGDTWLVAVVATHRQQFGASFALRHAPADPLWWSALHERLATTFKEDEHAPDDWLAAARWREAAGDPAGAAGLLERMLAIEGLDDDQVEAASGALARLARQRRAGEAERAALRRLADWRAQGLEGVALARRLLDEARRWTAAGFNAEAIAALDRAAAVPGMVGDEQVDLAYERARLQAGQGDPRGARSTLENLVRVLSATHPAQSQVAQFTAVLAARAGDNGPGDALLERWTTAAPLQAEGLANLLAGAALERQDQGRRLAMLQRLAVLTAGRRSAWYDAQVQYAEALVQPAQPPAEKAVPTAPSDAAASAAVAQYQAALATMPWRDHAGVAPRRQRAESALKDRKPQAALAQLRVAYLLATLCEDEAGRRLATAAAQVGDADAAAVASAGNATATMDPGWQVIGPFPLDNWRAYGRVIVDPNKVDLGKEVEGKKWRKVPPEAFPESRTIDLSKMCVGDNMVAFAYREFTVKNAGRAELSCGADDGLVLWVNGRKMYEDREQRGLTPDSIVVPVTLVAGVNRVLAMIQNGSGGWAFQCRLDAEAADPLGVQLAAMGLNPALHEPYQAALHQLADKARRTGRLDEAAALSRTAVRGFPEAPGRQLETAGLWWEGGFDDARLARELGWWAAGLAEREDVSPAQKDQPRPGLALRLRALHLLSLCGDEEGMRELAWRGRLTTLAGDEMAVLLAHEGEAFRRGGQPGPAAERFRRALDVGLVDQYWRDRITKQLPGLSRAARTAGLPLRPALEAATLLNTVERAAAGGDAERAARGWQRLIAELSDQAVAEDGRWVGAGVLAQERLRAASPAIQAQYRTLFEPVAGAALAKARQLGGRAALEGVAARFPLTAAAAQALGEAAALALDAGDPAAAADDYARLAQDASGVVRAQALAWVALCAAQAGDRQRADAALARLEREHAADALTIAGRPQAAGAWAAVQRRQLATAPAPAPWLGAGGDARRTGQAVGAPVPGGCAWLTTLPVAAADQGWDLRLAPAAWRHAGLQPALGGGLALVHTLDESFAIRLVDGRLAWRSGGAWSALDHFPRDDAWGGAVETATALAGDRCLVRRGHGLTGSVAVECRAVADGALLWSTAVGELAGWSAVTSPAAGGGRMIAVFQEAGERRRRELVAVDLAGGAVRWRVAVPGLPAGLPVVGQGVLPLTHGAAPTLAGGEVLWCTDGGVLASWDAAAGMLRWAAALPHADQDPGDGRRSLRVVAGRAASRVVAGADTVYVAPADALGVHALDRATGRLRWVRPLHAARQLAALAEGPDGALIVEDGFVEALDPATGATRWRWRPTGENEIPCGSAAVADGHVIVTTDVGCYRLRLADGRPMSLLRWAQAGVDLAGGGNVAVVDGAVVVAGRDRLALLSAAAGKARLDAVPPAPAVPVPGTDAGDVPVTAPLTLRWQLPGPQPLLIQRIAGSDDVLVAISDRMQRVAAATGQVRWTGDLLPDVRRVQACGDAILAVGPRGVLCLGAGDGRLRWLHALEVDDAGWPFGQKLRDQWMPVVDADAGKVVVSHLDGRGATLLDATTGRELRTWRFPTYWTRWVGLQGDTLVAIFSDDHKTWVEGFATASGERLSATDLDGVKRDSRWWRTARSTDRSRLALANEHALVVLDLAKRTVLGRSKAGLGEESRVDADGDGWAAYGRRSDRKWTLVTAAADGAVRGEAVYAGVDWPWEPAHPRMQDGQGFLLAERPKERAFAVALGADGAMRWEVDVGNRQQRGWAAAVPLGERVAVLWLGDSSQWAGWTLLSQADGRTEGSGDLPGGLGRCRNGESGLVACGGVLIYPGAAGGVYAVGGRPPAVGTGETAARTRAVVERPLAVAFSTRGPLAVDGRWLPAGAEGVTLDSDAAVRVEPGGTWNGAADAAAQVSWRWSRDRLVASVAVADDAVVLPPPGSLLDGDGLLLALSSEAEPPNRQQVAAPLLLHVALTAAGTRCLRLSGPVPEGAEQEPVARAVRTATGVAYEVGIPWALLRSDPAQRPGDRRLLGAGVAVLDADPGRPGTMLEWGAGLARGLEPRLLPRLNALDLAPERLAAFSKLRTLLPDHPLTGQLLEDLVAGFPGAGGSARRIAELEGFIRELPGSAIAARAIVRLAEAYRDGGATAAAADVRAAAMARTAKVPERAIGDALGPALANGAGRALSAWVWLDPKAMPAAVMLQFNTGGTWEHRAAWGADSLPWGQAGIPARTVLGPLPAPGTWTQLTIPVARLFLDHAQVAGIGFGIDGGRAVWDLVELVADGKRTTLLDDDWGTGRQPNGGDWIGEPVKSGQRAVTNGDRRGQIEFHTEGGAPYADLRAPGLADTPERWRDEFDQLVRVAGAIPDEPEAVELLLAAETIAADQRFPTAPASDVPLREFLAAHPDTPQAGRLLSRLAERWQGEGGKDRAAALERCATLMDELKLNRDQRRAFWTASAAPLQRWWVCGWFRDTNLEASIIPEAGQIDITKPVVLGDATIAWKVIEDQEKTTELKRHLGKDEGNGVAYALTRVEAPEAMNVYLRFACRGNARLWLNGERTGPALGSWDGQSWDAQTVPLRLSKGRNDLLLKVYGGDAWFRVRLTDSNGRPIQGVTYTP